MRPPRRATRLTRAATFTENPDEHHHPHATGNAARTADPRGSSLRPDRPLGRSAATNTRTVFIAWAVVAVALGLFAPRVETALSGAGWQANGSQSVQVRDLVQKEFGGLNSTGLMVVVHSPNQTATAPAFQHLHRAGMGALLRLRCWPHAVLPDEAGGRPLAGSRRANVAELDLVFRPLRAAAIWSARDAH